LQTTQDASKTSRPKEDRVSSQIATSIRQRVIRRSASSVRRQRRILAIQFLGLLTMLGGIVWSVAQPYRIAFLHRDGKGLYDYVVQPPLLVIIVGLVYLVLIAPGLIEDLERDDDGS